MKEPLDAEASEPKEARGRGWFWLALIVMLAVAGISVYRSALFRAGVIEITGLNRLTRERVVEAAGIATGVPRWEYSAADIRTRLLSEPWIASATVAWDWGRLSIDIKEREPVGLLRYSDRFYLVLDERGYVLGQTELDTKLNLPVVSGKVVSTALRGQQIPDPGVQDALFLLSRMVDPFRGQISEVSVAPDRALTLYMTAGATAEWGQVPDGKDRVDVLNEKIRYFGGVWKEKVKKRSVGCKIDLRVEGKYFLSGCD